MKINSIGVNYTPSVVYGKNMQNPLPQKSISPNFKGVRIGGALGGTIGTLAGVGLGAILTIGTGGLAAPILAGLVGCASGAISGDIIESSIKGNNDDSKSQDFPDNDDFHDRGV